VVVQPWYRAARLSAALAALLVATIVVSASVGPVAIAPPTVARVLLDGLPFISLQSPATARTIVGTIRLPRILLAAVVGCALGSAGAVMQGFFRNPMADPSIIGVSTGAALGAVAVVVLPAAVPLALQPAAFVGALVTGFGVYLLATRDGRTPVATLLLAGVAVQTFLGAVISLLLLQAGEGLERALYWLMGHLHAAQWGDLAVTTPVVLVGCVALLAYAHDLNVLVLGDRDARSLGIEVERTRRILLAVSSVVTAAAVAVAGVIGFVGLIVPHVVRLLVGPDHRVLVPTSAVAGAVFLVATDTVARAGPAQLPVGIVTAALGAPFFLYLLRREEVYGL
jgi:iron complex transport system permease protein